MTRIPPRAFSISPDELPPVRLDEPVVRNRLAKAGLPPETHDGIVGLLRQACHGYVVDRLGEELGVTPKEARAYLAKVQETVTTLFDLLDKTQGGPARAVIQQIEGGGLLPYGFGEALRHDAAEFARAATKAAEKIGQVKHGGASADKRARQLRFARGFIDTFAKNGWPMEMTHNSLMAQLLALCLAAVGEKYAAPENLLAAASES